MLSKAIDLKRVRPGVEALPNKDLTAIQAFFETYNARDCVILTRKQPADNNNFRIMNSYFMPNDGHGCCEWLSQMMKIRQQADTFISINTRFAYHNKKACRRIGSIHALDRIVVTIDEWNHKPMRLYAAQRIARVMQAFAVPVTAVIYTGRGVQIHFALQAEPHVYRYKNAYNMTAKLLTDAVYQFLCDNNFYLSKPSVLGLNDMCRLPGSFNTISFTYVTALYVNINHIVESNKPSLNKVMSMFAVQEPSAKRVLKQDVKKKKGMSRGFFDRMCDIYMELTAKKRIHIGNRNRSFYTYSYNLLSRFGTSKRMQEIVWNRLVALNKALDHPLGFFELQELFTHAVAYAQMRGSIVYSITKQLDWAGVDYSDIDGIPTAEYERKRHRRNAAKSYKAKSRQKKIDKSKLMEAAYKLHKKLGTISGVARELHLARETVRKYIRRWAELLASEHDAWLEKHMAAANDAADKTLCTTVTAIPEICMTN